MRSRPAGMLVAAVVAIAAFAWAQNKTATEAEEPPPELSTKVLGTVPDLAGRWLAVAQVGVPSGAKEGGIVVTNLWEVTLVDGAPRLALHFADLPPALAASLDEANRAKRSWEPDLRQLQELRDAWDRLRPSPRGAAAVETSLMGPDGFSDEVKSDESMKDARFIVQIVVAYRPGHGRPIKDIYIYGLKEQVEYGYRGNYASAAIAPTPIPIPISFNGTARLYRLESLPARGVLERLLGVFSGCGRGS